jgi:D-3-phosphoglycerate dehydrogenase
MTANRGRKVLVLDKLADEGLARLESESSIDVEVNLGLSGDALRDALANADVAICRSGVSIDAAALENNTRLKAIIRAGVGTDNIDKPAATRRGIIVMNTPAANTISTAEHTMALLLGLSRNLARASASLREGKWDRKAHVGTQLHGKTLGIIGLGRIGREVASRAIAFGMQVVGFDSFLAPEKARELGIEPVDSLEELLPQVDFLSVHTPLTPETRNLLNETTLELMRPGARIINCARGGIYEESAVIRALSSGKLAGAAFDVYENEPCTDSPLFSSDRTLCTPHLGASTEEAQTQVSVEAVELALNFLKAGEIQHAVNAVTLDAQTLKGMRGYLNLTYRLGLLLAQLQEGRHDRCRVRFRGDIAAKDTRLLQAAFCAGLIERAMDESVNIVNAEMLLSERGIEHSSEANPEQGAFRSSVSATVESAEGQETTAAVTLFGNNMPRLIQIDDFRLEAFLDGVMLVFNHQDIPGIVGSIGTILGNQKINIAQMAVGRAGDRQGGSAVGILNLDSKPDAETLSLIGLIEGMDTVRVVELPVASQLPAWLPEQPR